MLFIRIKTISRCSFSYSYFVINIVIFIFVTILTISNSCKRHHDIQSETMLQIKCSRIILQSILMLLLQQEPMLIYQPAQSDHSD